MLGMKPGIHVTEVVVAAQHEAGRSDQQDGQRNLTGHEHVLEPVVNRRTAASAFGELRRKVSVRACIAGQDRTRAPPHRRWSRR
jgi:hypothetical protein